MGKWHNGNTGKGIRRKYETKIKNKNKKGLIDRQSTKTMQTKNGKNEIATTTKWPRKEMQHIID